jgi:hypothetical protein
LPKQLRRLGYFDFILKTSIHLVPVERYVIPHIYYVVTFNRDGVVPDRVFTCLLTNFDAPVPGVTFDWSVRFVGGLLQQIHSDVFERKVVNGLVVGLMHDQYILTVYYNCALVNGFDSLVSWLHMSFMF